MVYVDTAPGVGALDPEFTAVEKPMVWSDIEAAGVRHWAVGRVEAASEPAVQLVTG